ncbi:galactonate dehydratase [Nonomuraea pusilla]|uniref:Galactonate dehydratase n=1 Tax=Nonomuraea pusilla TaxID=46177 RepID=A0A1H8ABD2_9ACTN|nr:galactonate dehydratase [Nonomuraea pusilla]SEM68192.1 galactonate dehydratase [Nonomuraea pusilla]
MKITSVETFVLSNRRLLVKISTSAGVAGWGEATLENWVRPVDATVRQMAGYLVGQDPRRITHHWQVLARGGFYRGGPVILSALAGIDQALWDIKGRSLNAPIHELLGGAVRDSVRIYAHSNSGGEHTGDPDRAAMLASHGYTMVKVAAAKKARFTETQRYVEEFVEDIRDLRSRVGGDVDIAIDLHGRFSTALARHVLPLLEPFHPAFVEEPLRPEHSDQLGRITATTSIPIATGERLYSREEFLRVLPHGIAIVQPDLSHAGGITECFRIATLAESHDAQIAPHCPLGPVALAACLQLDAAVPNFHTQETVIEVHDPGAGLGLELLRDPTVLRPVAGRIPVLTGPGLGIEIDEEAVREAVVAGPLSAGADTWLYEDDGSFAEW